MPTYREKLVEDVLKNFYKDVAAKEKTMDKRDNITNIIIEGDGKKTVALVASDKNGKIIETVHADCAPEDVYNFNIGASLCMDRLYKDKDLTPRSKELYSGKILFIDTDHEDNKYFYGTSCWDVIGGLIPNLCVKAGAEDLRIEAGMPCSKLSERIADMYFIDKTWSKCNKVMYLDNRL